MIYILFKIYLCVRVCVCKKTREKDQNISSHKITGSFLLFCKFVSIFQNLILCISHYYQRKIINTITENINRGYF